MLMQRSPATIHMSLMAPSSRHVRPGRWMHRGHAIITPLQPPQVCEATQCNTVDAFVREG
jgi:hypothetical protein